MIQIIIDDREQSVIPYFNQAKIPPNMEFKVSRIHYGDYSVLYKDQILFVIERKTWKDLASSMKDGRKHNVNKMIKLREDTGCHLIYLIEGNPLPKRTMRFCRIPYKNLRSHLDHISFRDGIHVVHSKNIADTVVRIIELVQNYITIKPSPLLEIDAKVDGDTEANKGETKLKEKIEVSEESIIYKIWSCVPNITEKTAYLFINKNYHISDLILGNITKDEIFSLKYDNGFIIGKRSNKIWDCSRPLEKNNKYFSKMLIQINGITKNTANIILDTISWEELLKGDISKETLSQIQKSSSGRKIGNKVSENIIKYYVKK
jgi:ERCC4-type nuclease